MRCLGQDMPDGLYRTAIMDEDRDRVGMAMGLNDLAFRVALLSNELRKAA